MPKPLSAYTIPLGSAVPQARLFSQVNKQVNYNTDLNAY